MFLSHDKGRAGLNASGLSIVLVMFAPKRQHTLTAWLTLL
jgi:hypothetical protein